MEAKKEAINWTIIQTDRFSFTNLDVSVNGASSDENTGDEKKRASSPMEVTRTSILSLFPQTWCRVSASFPAVAWNNEGGDAEDRKTKYALSNQILSKEVKK